MRVNIRCNLDYAVGKDSPVLLQIEAAELPDQHVTDQKLGVHDAQDFVRVEADEAIGERSLFRVERPTALQLSSAG